jgi:hypothetical protein
MVDVGFNDRLIPLSWDALMIGSGEAKEPSWSR